MKTWRDFDVRVIQRLVQNHLDDAVEWSDMVFAQFMNRACEDLSVRVPCLVCGVKYPLNDLDHTCRPEDMWINTYVHSPHGSAVRQTGYQPHVARLRKKYPLLDTHHVLYRGLHFATESDFTAFATVLGDNNYRSSSATSWTTDSARAASARNHPNDRRARRYDGCVRRGARVVSEPRSGLV